MDIYTRLKLVEYLVIRIYNQHYLYYGLLMLQSGFLFGLMQGYNSMIQRILMKILVIKQV